MKLSKDYFKRGASKWIDESYSSQCLLAPKRFEISLKLLKQYKINSLLDIGCGDGRLLSNSKVIKIKYGIDYSKEMLKLAKKKNDINTKFLEIDLNSVSSFEKLCNNSNVKFDFITMLGVVHYLSNPLFNLTNIFKILDKNSKFLISFRNRLFNIKINSKYKKSILTKHWYPILNLEKNYLENKLYINKFQNLKNFLTEKNILEIISVYENQNSWLGITDTYWKKPISMHWRQFTIIESLILLQKAGFKYFKYIPLTNEKIPSSFSILAK